jgi:heme/copper-type cytochrome/quinol oxidase subunit 4
MEQGDVSFFGLIIQLGALAFFVVMLEIVGRPWWWIILFFIPLVNIVIGFLVALDLSRSFGHDLAFALGLFFLGIIFYPILAFGGDTYAGPAAAG